jgi:uncharacterized membrane protein YkvI
MKDCVMAFLSILGTVIGSGFISGKEIVVFFSRFGVYSFLAIPLAFILFFLLFKLMLGRSCVKMSKFDLQLNLFICVIFSSAMFSGIANLLVFNEKILNFIVFFAILLISFVIFKKGLGSLNKLNVFLVPFMIGVLAIGLISKLGGARVEMDYNFSFRLGGMSFVYSLLYVILNTSNAGVLIAKLGQKLSARAKTRVAFVSALVLCLLLLFADIVLLADPSSFEKTMPLLSLFEMPMRLIMTIAVFIGCLTTLFTLIWTSSTSMRGLCKNEFLIFSVSVLLPLILSLLGFDFIVQYLYPISSIIGIYLICDLFFISFFKRTNKKVHSTGKNT